MVEGRSIEDTIAHARIASGTKRSSIHVSCCSCCLLKNLETKFRRFFPVFPLPTDDLELLSSLASDGAENESFEELFQKLAVMKGQEYMYFG